MLYSNHNRFDSNCYNYVYEKNKNFCSGYFPSFIILPIKKFNLISQNNQINNISNNYYIKINEGKYLKQVTNPNSKYDLNYLNNMRSKCQGIINKHLITKKNREQIKLLILYYL